jgi:glyoxylase-like metal-dependent hydrolase (beta-lactamase superfamily II)
MLALEAAHGVTRLHLWSRLGRALGYTASAYLARGVLVDTGFPHAARDVRALLERERPRAVVVTHAHEDHGGNAALAAALGIPVVASAATLARLRAPAPLPLYRRLVWGTPRALPAGHGATAHPALAGAGLELVAAPGHAPDHAVVWDAGRGHLFGGDLFLGVRVRIAHTEEEPRELVRTLRWAAALEPAVLFDAHRGPVAAPAPLLRAKADWLEATVGEVERLADAGLPEREIRRRVLGREPLVAVGSRGEYGKRNLVRAALAGRGRRAAVDVAGTAGTAGTRSEGIYA